MSLAALPPELLEHVLCWLPGVLAYAPVSRMFAQLAARVQLAQSREQAGGETMQLTGAALSALGWYVPPAFIGSVAHVKALECVLEGRAEMLRQTRVLRTLVRATPNLRQLDVTFSVDPFLAPGPSIRRTIFDAICGALADAAGRHAPKEPVFIVLAGAVFSCRAADIRRWRLDVFRYHPSWLPSGSVEYPGDTVRSSTHLRTLGRFPTLRQLNSLSLQLIPATTKSSAFTLLVFNPGDIVYLSFPSSQARALAIYPNRSRILRHLHLPNLRAVRICDEFFKPDALRHFLETNTTLQLLTYDPQMRAVFSIYRSRRSPDAARSIVACPPLPHPSLRSVRLITSNFRASAGHILGTLADSPPLRRVELLFNVATRGPRAAELVVDLAGLARRPGPGAVTLNLVDAGVYWWDVPGRWAAFRTAEAFWARTPAALGVAPALHCVGTVWLAPRTFALAEDMLPFLALLPALRLLSVAFVVRRLARTRDRRRLAMLGSGKLVVLKVPGGKSREKTRAEVEADVQHFLQDVVRPALPAVPMIVYKLW
ncbi:hypothetical protein MIND_01242500 [Mycena indigotica]|uniref:F-box domain-containing protein n=1 Tax=Mycena indigotica TaxID=2126181 RepID=A0A8H6S4N3_9AGAR|nr:uncharacterized protein MIND_01242500 [Mycena indigotica]KAF7292155.1 hypothetical protein MIND_01242500 [Mycena indigotica]